MNVRKTAAVWAAAGIMTLAVSCAGADSSGEVTKSVSTESLSEVFSETNEEISDNSEDFSDIFAYRIIDGNVRIVKYIGNDKFAVIPDTIEGLSVTMIKENAFADRIVTELTLPAEIENVSAKMIRNTKELQYIYISGNSEKYISVDGVILTADGKTLVMYPGGRTGEAEIPEGVTRIGDNAFYGCKITGVSLPETVEEIGISAFEQCSGLKEITIPGSVKAIEPYAFCGSGLLNITVSDGVESIGTGAFESTKIMELYLPDSLTSAGNYILGSERGARINACEPREGLQNLEKYEGMSYRNETVLEGAIRSARSIAERKTDYYYRNRVYLTDIDGDDFPEMLTCRIYKNDEGEWESPQGVYRYNTVTMEWEQIIGLRDTNLSVYRDRENGGYMQIGVGDYSETSDYLIMAIMRVGNEAFDIGSATWNYPINGYYDTNEGYVTGFEGGGKYEIYETKEINNRHFLEEKAFAELINSTVDSDRYELVSSFNFPDMAKALGEQFGNNDESLVICGNFADSPDSERADFSFADAFDDDGWFIYPYNTEPETDSESVIIGERVYDEYSYSACLHGDEICTENFEKLASLPCLTSLSLYCDNEDSVIDLTGIKNLKKLRRMYIGKGTLKNAEVLKGMDIVWLEVSGAANDLGFMAYLDKVRVLEIGYSMSRPDDYYAAVADMDSLRYITVSVFEENITDEQEENIRSLRPDVAFCYFKVG
ncbi:MAG: leucine-rich repeat domain-containing protein [Oscillospiraceae bacterium]|nr:leucine-rich repeat domain-containing protein [Oscillospiraceae bacterium]